MTKSEEAESHAALVMQFVGTLSDKIADEDLLPLESALDHLLVRVRMRRLGVGAAEAAGVDHG